MSDLPGRGLLLHVIVVLPWPSAKILTQTEPCHQFPPSFVINACPITGLTVWLALIHARHE